MSSNGQVPEAPHSDVFNENQRKVPAAHWLPFAGQHVAWSLDGTRILAGGKDLFTVEKNLAAAGIDPRQVVFGYIDPPDVAVL